MSAEIRVINFDNFQKKGEMPRFPDDKHIAENLSSLDRNNFLLGIPIPISSISIIIIIVVVIVIIIIKK